MEKQVHTAGLVPIQYVFYSDPVHQKIPEQSEEWLTCFMRMELKLQKFSIRTPFTSPYFCLCGEFYKSRIILKNCIFLPSHGHCHEVLTLKVQFSTLVEKFNFQRSLKSTYTISSLVLCNVITVLCCSFNEIVEFKREKIYQRLLMAAESHLIGWLCYFVPKFMKGSGTHEYHFPSCGRRLRGGDTHRWHEHLNPTCYNQINLNSYSLTPLQAHTGDRDSETCFFLHPLMSSFALTQ